MEGPAKSQLRRVLKLRDESAKLEAKAKAKANELHEAEMEVHEAMEGAGLVGNHKYDLGKPWGVVGFQAGQKRYSNVYDLEAFVEWAEEHGYKDAFLSENPKPREKVVNQYVRRSQDQGLDLPAGVEPRRTRFMTVRLPKSK